MEEGFQLNLSRFDSFRSIVPFGKLSYSAKEINGEPRTPEEHVNIIPKGLRWIEHVSKRAAKFPPAIPTYFRGSWCPCAF